MVDLPLEESSGAQWVDGDLPTRQRRRDLVITRRVHLASQQ
ncbi:hypothetical protein [Streptomyces deserti]